MVALDRANFVIFLLHMRVFWQQFTIQILIFRSHEYLIVSVLAPIVRGPYINKLLIKKVYIYII